MANKMAWSALLFGMLIGGAMVMYQAQLTDAFRGPKVTGDPESNSRQEKVTPLFLKHHNAIIDLNSSLIH